MSSKNSDQLFQLIQSLSKGEKRHFKLFATRHKGGENAKFLKLFDMINAQKEYSEDKILSKEKSIHPDQLPNIKQHLYKQILQSLRLLHGDNDVNLKIRENLDNAAILYNKCLYTQSNKHIEKAKEMCIKYENNTYLLEVHEMEKKIASKLVKRDIQEKIDALIPEGNELQKKISNIITFSNLSTKLYGLYTKFGFTRNSKDFEIVNSFLYSTLPAFKEEDLSAEEKINLYNALVGYYFFIQDSRRAYDYALKWVNLYDKKPDLIVSKTESYIKAINNLLDSQYKLSRYEEFIQTSLKFESIKNRVDLNLNENLLFLLFKYSSKHTLDKYFMLGEFDKGVQQINDIAQQLQVFEDEFNEHSKLIYYYKFACMYFGNDDYKNAVYWLNQIINARDEDLRSDILCFARILNLISHYELRNDDLVEYYIKSTYRFLGKKDDLHFFQTRILRFLKRLNTIQTNDELTAGFKELKDQLLPLTSNPYEKRAFVYFDIISWLESKIEQKPVKEIIRYKALKKIESANQPDM
jgi:hypothetical protein